MQLKTIIKPFYKFMNRLDYASKFGVIMFLFAAPLFVLVVQLFIASNMQLKQARQHSLGMDAMLRAHTLITALEEWRDITVLNFVSSDPDFRALHRSALDRAKQSLSDTRQFLIEKQHRRTLGYLDQLDKELDDPAIAPGMEGITIELVFDNVHRYVEQAYDWQRQLATHYGLLGIPDDRMFRVMNLFLYDVGDAYEAAGRARVFGAFFLHTGFIDSSGTYVIDKTFAKLEKQAENIKAKLDSIIALGNTTVKNSDVFLVPLFGVLERMDQQLIQVTSLDAPWRGYYDSTGALRETARNMEEGYLLKSLGMFRLAMQEKERDRLLLQGATVLLILLTILLYTGFYYSVRNTITHLVNSAEAVAAGDLDRVMRTHTHDELSLLGRALDNMREQLKARQSYLHQASITDGLTGLHNRNYFDQVLKAEVNRAKRGQHSLALILLDIDHFKSINDNYGHMAGDACIRYVAERLLESVKRASDTAARYGGEEFAIILPDSSREHSVEIAEQLRLAIQQSEVQYEDSDIRFTISCGVASLIPQSTTSIADFIRTADEALYEAKRTGRNRTIAKDLQGETLAAEE